MEYTIQVFCPHHYKGETFFENFIETHFEDPFYPVHISTEPPFWLQLDSRSSCSKFLYLQTISIQNSGTGPSIHCRLVVSTFLNLQTRLGEHWTRWLYLKILFFMLFPFIIHLKQNILQSCFIISLHLFYAQSHLLYAHFCIFCTFTHLSLKCFVRQYHLSETFLKFFSLN